MQISRHYLMIGSRRVHYRRCGSGPVLLMVHQSPRSSAEYAALMQAWGAHFTCIAPDTPGFGQSDPLPLPDPDINDFADALVDFIGALGVDRIAAYGFHSGGIILVTALARHPQRFSGLAVGGYAIWNAAEMAIFGAAYLPPFQPTAYGEHLTWLWNRILEQSWFFPWFDVRDAARLSVAHDDVDRVNAVVHEMLDSGDAYRLGYGAVLRAPRDIPPPDTATPPVLITAYAGDPLEPHLARLGAMPANWSAASVATPQAHHDASLSFLRAHAFSADTTLREAVDAGFVRIETSGYAGLIHWRGSRRPERLVLHAPGKSIDGLDDPLGLFIDLPGHGLSDDWDVAPATLDAWVGVVAAATAAIAAAVPAIIVGQGASLLLAAAVATHLGAAATGGFDVHLPHLADTGRWLDSALPDLTPDRHGGHLTRTWSVVRAGHFYWPWFDARAATAIPFDPADIAPERLAIDHRALVRARAGRSLLALLLTADRDVLLAAAPPLNFVRMADWATARSDIWQPQPRTN